MTAWCYSFYGKSTNSIACTRAVYESNLGLLLDSIP